MNHFEPSPGPDMVKKLNKKHQVVLYSAEDAVLCSWSTSKIFQIASKMHEKIS